MPFSINEIIKAHGELLKFRHNQIYLNNKNSKLHERFIFPFLCGSYFTYRKIDVIRILKIAQAISNNPTYLDIGCGYGDFLEKVREYIPNAEGMEKSIEIFYSIGKIKPNYIKISDAYYGLEKKYDVIFVGWMEPGVDYRDKIAEATDCIITTLDQGGQCGLNGMCEFEEFGFERIAKWITPSWEDINTEITNKYYSKVSSELYKTLSNLRGAHNFWYVYCTPNIKGKVMDAIKKHYLNEQNIKCSSYDFESIIDDVGYKYLENLNNPYLKDRLWDINF